MKKMSFIGIAILVLVLVLESASTLNLVSALFSKKRKFKNYPYLKDGITSENYSIDKVSDSYNLNILYDDLHNFFIVNEGINVKVIDGVGNIKHNLSLDVEYERSAKVQKLLGASARGTTSRSNMEIPFRTHYAFADTFLYDLSKDQLQKEAFKTIINPPDKIPKQEWLDIFKGYYEQADIVIYGSGRFAVDKSTVYFKVGSDWTLLYMSDRHHLKEKEGEQTFEGYPAKYQPMVLLKDEHQNRYTNSPSSYDKSIPWEKKFQYSKKKFKPLYFKKEIIYETIVYTPIPIAIGGTAFYHLNLGNETIQFKEKAIRNAFFLSKVQPHLHFYTIPKKFQNQSQISFLECAYPSNINESGSKGLFVIRPKPM